MRVYWRWRWCENFAHACPAIDGFKIYRSKPDCFYRYVLLPQDPTLVATAGPDVDNVTLSSDLAAGCMSVTTYRADTIGPQSVLEECADRDLFGDPPSI